MRINHTISALNAYNQQQRNVTQTSKNDGKVGVRVVE